MIVKKRTYPVLARLEALRHRSTLSENDLHMLQSLTHQKSMEEQFEAFLTPEVIAKVDVIWHYTYQDYHRNIHLNVILVESDTIHLLKLNTYQGLHTIKHQGMLTEFFSGRIHEDLAQLMSIKLGLQYLMDRTLNIEMRAVCLSPDFELDAHSQNRMILTAETLPDYLTQMTTSKINLSYSAIQFAETTDVPYKVAASIKNGLRCPHCEQLSEFNFHHHLILCLKCREISQLEQAFIRAAHEYMSLYPENRLTKDIMYKWCNKKIPAAKVASLLKKHFKTAGKTKGTYYLLEN
ncbi:hypothetical protein ERX27_01585 [Macrococcus brunensis]|uniref:NERD domain-containing protein n=1 Tax=Macrococcus brunensis TaxID=198483 RepID=A0A4R6BG58_9STAP|nr:hypothetical protein [Macrococcus brunensis]TDL98812.1 hypothetical protein ERX27_01585 [Macrococcus brunensis]